jgi:hypothetical protein
MSLKSILFPKLNHSPRLDLLPPMQPQSGVPRIIHQTFYSRELPGTLQENVARLRALNPGWEYRFYDDQDIEKFIAESYPPAIIEYYNRINPQYGAARADLFRYLLMYKIGGVYLDIKSTATKPLDDVIFPQDEFLLSEWDNGADAFGVWGKHYELAEFGGREFQQWHIACAPGHPFLRAVIGHVLGNIDTYISGLHGTGKAGVLRVTGPIAYSLAIHRIIDKHPHRKVGTNNDLGFEYTVMPINSHKKEFRSHYSLQKAPIVKTRMVKRQLSHVYGLIQTMHDLAMRKRGNGASQ